MCKEKSKFGSGKSVEDEVLERLEKALRRGKKVVAEEIAKEYALLHRSATHLTPSVSGWNVIIDKNADGTFSTKFLKPAKKWRKKLFSRR